MTRRKKKATTPAVVVPTTVEEVAAKAKLAYDQQNYSLLALDIVVLIAAILVALECAAALKRHLALAAAEQADGR